MMKSITLNRSAAVALTICCVLGACTTVQTTQGGEVGVNRKQTMTSLVSSEQIEKQAAQEYAQVLAQAQKKGLLNQNPQQVQRVRAVAARLIPQVGVFRPDAVKWKWEVNVLTSKDINAWCMPGGKIAVYTALLERLNLTDDELAAVMGHEIAHALREHARERMGRQMATQTATAVGSIALEIFTGVLPHTASVADDLCVINSMYTEAINHGPGVTLFQTGSQIAGRPSMGAWLSYGLGQDNANLPSFVVLITKDKGGQPLGAHLVGQRISSDEASGRSVPSRQGSRAVSWQSGRSQCRKSANASRSPEGAARTSVFKDAGHGDSESHRSLRNGVFDAVQRS